MMPNRIMSLDIDLLFHVTSFRINRYSYYITQLSEVNVNVFAMTDRHKDMLTLLASGLHLGYTKPTWGIFFSGTTAYLIVGLDDQNRMSPSQKQLWYTVTYEDLNFFTEAELMRDLHHMAVSPNRYIQLNVEHILDEFLPETVSL